MGPDRGERYTMPRVTRNSPVRWGPIVMLQGCSAYPQKDNKRKQKGRPRSPMISSYLLARAPLADEAAVDTHAVTG